MQNLTPSFVPETGLLLVAGTGLRDENFKRTVILLCEHTPGGSFGLTLNRPLDLTVADAIEGLEVDAPLYLGGPVQNNTIHVLHTCRDLADSSAEIMEGVYWGGDFNLIRELLNARSLTHAAPDDFRFYLGYAGWGEGQLDRELAEDAWFLADASADTDSPETALRAADIARDFILTDQPDRLWSRVLKAMGGDYAILSNYPEDPRLN